MTNTVIEIKENDLNYYKLHNVKYKKIKYIELIILSIIFLTISFLFFIAQCYDYKPISELNKFKRIKINMSKWRNNIIEKTGIEINRGKRVSLLLNDSSIFNFQVYDFGNYYAAMRLNSSTFLPEFIRRGNGDVWRVIKAAKKDLSALQFCNYLIINHSSNFLTCGILMYNDLGYGGYFNINHPCQNALDILITSNSKLNAIEKF